MKNNNFPNDDHEIELSVEEITNDIIRVFTIVTESSNIPFYLFNNVESRFLQVSSAFCELMNINYADFKSSKVTDFSDLIHEKDMVLLAEIMETSEALIRDYRIRGKDLYNTMFFTNFRVKTATGGYRHIDHYSYPINIKNKEMPILSVNMVQPSRRRGTDRLTFYSGGQDIRLIYSQKQKKFLPEHKMSLKEIELEILRLSADGLVEKQICDKLEVKPSMINYYKRRIFNKLNVTSIQEAIYVALISGLI